MHGYTKIALITSVLVASFAFAGCKGESPELSKAPKEPSVAFVDMEQVYEKSSLAASGVTYLEGVGQELQAELVEIQKDMMVPEKAEDPAFQASIQERYLNMQKVMNQEQERVAGLVGETFNTVVEECRKEGNYAAILQMQAVVANDPSLDLTAKVLEKLDARKIDFAAKKTVGEEAGKPDADKPSGTDNAPDAKTEMNNNGDATKAEAPKADATKAPADASLPEKK